MLSRGRYQALHRNETDFKRWAYGLQSAGYATEGDYANLLIEIIERYELNRLDEM
jgi:flagellum-specific peptidoglycan hydrolase FlgJ